MALSKPVKILAGVVAALAAALTVVVYTKIIVDWFTPHEQVKRTNETTVSYVDSIFVWPRTYDKATADQKKYFQGSLHLIGLEIHNTGETEQGTLSVLLPHPGIIEVRTDHADLLGPSDTFHLIPLAPGKRMQVFVWTQRPLLPEDTINVLIEGTVVTFKPTVTYELSDIQFYEKGFYALIWINALELLTKPLIWQVSSRVLSQDIE